MDRDPPNSPRVLATKPNGIVNSNSYSSSRVGKIATQSFGYRRTSRNMSKPESKENVTSDTDISIGSGSRHPLYSSPKYIPNSNSFSASARRRSESPRETRIPRPKSATPVATSPNERDTRGRQQQQSPDMRQPMSFKSAFALARKQEVDVQFDDDDTFSIKHAFNIASAEMDRRIDGSPSPAPRNPPLRSQSPSLLPRRTFSGSSNNDLGRHLQRFDRNHQLGTGNRPLNGLFNKAQTGSKALETGTLLAKKASNSSLKGIPVYRRDTQREARLGKEDGVRATVPIPSIEYESASDDHASPIEKPTPRSPEKSYNWQLDADFTAGDLQVSDSPRIRAGQSNARPTQPPSPMSSPVASTPNMRRSNSRIDQIRQKEIEAANAVLPEEDISSSIRATSRLEELRAREREALSKRAVATSRLEEIRIRNSEARAESPETGGTSNREDLRRNSLHFERAAATPENKSGSIARAEQVSNTPATSFRDTSDQKLNESPKEKKGDTKAEDDGKGAQLPRNDSHDLLQRLARATSNSPSFEKVDQPVIPDNAPPKEEPRGWPRPTREERRLRNLEVKSLDIKSSRERPTVGFAGLQRTLSSDSIKEKRASRSGSEADPTDRIEAEMKLFAPLDNYSEKGSVRAPSPIPPEPLDEETPRSNKIDPLTQPTPRVTGAYVDTPATVKVKKESLLDDKTPGDSNQTDTIPNPRIRSSSDPSNEGNIKSEFDDDSKSSGRASIPRSSSVPAASRRAGSTSRRRRPRRPVINTANPPSVKDDIRAILRMNQIDDSTLEDFDTILADQDIDDEELEKMVNDTMDKIEDDSEFPGLSERDHELQIYDRMSKSLKTGLLGIRSAKKGIERLEDKVMHTEHKADQAHADPNATSPKPEMRTATVSVEPGSVLIALPALYRKSPRFRPTKLGVFTLIFFIWYIVESVFCFLYTPQYECTPDVPCDWSPNEPYFPYAIPFMLDEWTTGGKGRKLTWRIGEEIGDMFAEVTDWVTNTDFTQFDEKYMNVWQRKRHRRRLAKHGLVPKWVPPPDYKPRFAEWNAARLAREAAEEEEEDDYYETEDETMSADERIR